MGIQYLYSLIQEISISECSVVGIIDGSGSMSQCWQHLCKAWNEFINTFKSSFCIQFDDTAELQEKPQLFKQKGGFTMIQLGFVEFIKLIRTNQLLKQLIVIFITDGEGQDRIEDYVEDLAKDFNQFHKEDYQIKFYTLAVGKDFSYQIVAELKNRIHNSNLISSQMEYILVPETDFKIKLDAIKKDVFYKFIDVQPPIQLVPNGELHTKVVANQTILSTNSIIKINGQEIDLQKIELTQKTLNQFIRQILAKLMEENSRGVDVQQSAQNQLDIVKQFDLQIQENNLENKPLRDRINQNIGIIEQFSKGELKFNNIQCVDAAKLMKNLYFKIKDQKSLPKGSIEETELAMKKLDNIRRQVKTKPVFQDILKLYSENTTKRPEYLVKKAMEGKGGAQLQYYATEFEAETTKIFSFIHILQGEI